MASAYPRPQAPGPLKGLPHPGPDGHYGAEHYFQYTNVNAPKVFEWGYRRGNDPEHFREEYLSQKDHTFKAKVSYSVKFLSRALKPQKTVFSIKKKVLPI